MFRVEEYIRRNLHQCIVDPDENMIYTRRKLHFLGSSISVGESSNAGIRSSSDTAASSNTLTTAQIPKFPADGWGISLEKSPHFTRVEMDKHVARSGKNMGAGVHLSLPTGLAKAKTYLQDDYLHDIQTNYDQRYFFYRAKCFHSFKRNENPHNLDLALCIVSGDVMYANCGPSCAAGKSGFCNHILALMLKVCKYTLYNCVNVTELKDEVDQNSSTVCTSALQTWHKPRVEGISPYPVMEIAVLKTRLQDHKSCGIVCQLYEARKVNRKSKLQEFVSSVQSIDSNLGLIQTCDVSKIGEGELVETRFGESPAGSFGSYQLTFQESNFKVTCNIPVNSVRQLGTPFNTSANYPSLPLDDFNDDFVLNLPNDMGDMEKKIVDGLSVNLLKANQIEEETRAQHTCETWVQERKYRLTASKFGRIARRQRNHEKLCEDMLNAKPVKTKSTEHGIKYEPIALREYEKHMHKIGHPVKVEKSGFFVSPKIFFLGCSPDGKVVDSVSQDQFGLAEVKCPSSKFNVTPEEACSDPSFCLELVNGSPRLKRNHEYYDQIQGQMALTGAKWCDFVVYTSRGLNIERIPFDKERWSYVLAILHRTYFRYFLPAAAKKKYGSPAQ